MIFSEKRYFAEWIRLLFLLLIVFIALGISANYRNVPLLMILLLLFVVFSVLLVANLSVTIDLNSINVRFFPFHLKPVAYRIEDITAVGLVHYDPIREFGGWGIRVNHRKEKIFSISGNHALFIVMGEKKRYIGISNTAAVQDFLLSNFPHIYKGTN